MPYTFHMDVDVASQRGRQNAGQRERLRVYGNVILSGVLMLTVFWLDLLTPLGLAVPGLYAAIVLLSSYARVLGLPYVMAGVASVLIVTGLLRAPTTELTTTIVLGNRLLYLVFAWVAAYALDRIERSRRLIEERDAQLARLAREDGLTGVANRRHFEERYNGEFQRAMRARSPLSLLMIDIDHFKRYNDTEGHQIGDHCLRAVADAIGAALRRPSDFVARYGGEEFVVLLPGTRARGARQQAETIRRAVAHLSLPHTGSPHGNVTISVGVANATPGLDGTPPTELLRAADRALYRAKRGGRNRVEAAPAAAPTRRRQQHQSRRGEIPRRRPRRQR